MAYPDYGTFPKYGGGGSFPASTPVSATTDTGYLSYSSAGRLFLPAGTNYIIDPAFAAPPSTETIGGSWWSVDGWTFENLPGGVLHASYTGTPADVNAMKYITALASAVGTFLQNEVFTHSVEVMGTLTNCALTLDARTRNAADSPVGGYPATISPAISASTFTRYSRTATIAESTSSRIRQLFWISGVNNGSTADLYFRRPLLEKSSILTPYFDGSSPERGCSWSGAANASTSTRAVSLLQLPLTGFDNASTVAMRVTPLFSDSLAINAYFSLLYNSGSTSVRQRLYWLGSSGKWSSYGYDGTNNPVISSADPTFSANSSHRLVSRTANSTPLCLSVDGTAITPVTNTCTVAGLNTAYIGTMSTLGAGFEALSYIGPVAICPTRITDAETLQLDSVLASCSGAELYKWFYDRGYYGTLILPLEGSAQGYIVGGGSTYRDNYAYSTVAATTDTGYEVYA